MGNERFDIQTSGMPGPPGKQLLSGPRAPSALDGAQGEYWVDTVAGALYGPKAGTSWPLAVNWSGIVADAEAARDGAVVAEDGAETARAGAEAAEAGVLAALAGTSLSDAILQATDRTILAGLDTSLGLAALLVEPGGGVFTPEDKANYPGWAILGTASFVPSTFDATKVWVRQNQTVINLYWFMTPAQILDSQAFGYTLNTTAAWRAAAAVINTLGGCDFIAPPGGYLVGEQIPKGTLLDQPGAPAAYGPTHIFYVKDCPRPVRVKGFGAVLKAIPGYKYGSFDRNTGLPYNPPSLPFTDYSYYSALYRGMIEFENCDVVVGGIELDGNVENVQFGGYFDNSTWQVQGTGIWLMKCRSFLELNVNSHDHALDDRIIAWTGLTAAAPAYPHTLINPKGRYATRNSLSITGCNKLTIINPDFSMTGQRVNVGRGAPAQSTPGFGIDIEAEGAIVRNVAIINPTIQGNWVCGIGGSVGDSRGVQVMGGLVENVIIARPRYSFTGTTLVGRTEFSLPLADQYKPAATGVTLTIAGSGPHTITRGSGDFTTGPNAFAVGNQVVLPTLFAGAGANAGISAANKNKVLLVTGLTATVMTVTVVGGGTLTAEGPIASSIVATATTANDGTVLQDVHVSYDATRLERGALINAGQSQWNQGAFAKYRNVSVDCGAVALPNLNYIGTLDSAPLLENCSLTSTATTPVNLWARYQGRNFVTYGTTPGFGFGTTSRLEASADVIANGASQSPVGVDPRGDVIFVLTVGSKNTQYVNAPLSTNRQCVLPAPGNAGRRFRIVRSAASTGPSTLSVQTSGAVVLKALAVGTFAEVEDDGTEYRLMETGAAA